MKNTTYSNRILCLILILILCPVAQGATIEIQNHEQREVLVQFKLESIDLETFSGRTRSNLFFLAEGLDKQEDIPEANISVIQIDENESVEGVIAQLQTDPRVAHVQPNYKYSYESTNDALFGSQWGLNQISDMDIDAPEAWAISEGNDIIVAVIDSGVAYNHPDLAGNMWDGSLCVDELGQALGGCLHGYDYGGEDKDPLPDNETHGTHVAGTIAAIRNNSIGIAGVAPQAKIMALKTDLYTDEIIKSIAFAKNNGAKIINASWGGTFFDQMMYEAIEDFPGIFIAAAGNNGTDNDTDPHYPSNYDLDNIISVAASNQSDQLSSFSNFGQFTVDLAAPGQSILSTVAQSIDIVNHTFDSVIVPALPSGFTNGGTWGTYNNLSTQTLIGDIQQFPYTNNNDSTVTFPSLDLSTYHTGNISFSVECDTEYITNGWADYVAVEVSGDGVNFVPMKDPTYDLSTWYIDEPYLDDLLNDPTGSAQGFMEAYLPSSVLTENFTLRFRWVTNSTDNNHEGCQIDNLNIGTFSDGVDAQYGTLSGTSMAAPHVAGVAALLLLQEPTLSVLQLRELFLNGGDMLASLDGKVVSGKRLNARGTLDLVGTTKSIVEFEIDGGLRFIIDDAQDEIEIYVSESEYPLNTPTIKHTGASVSPLSGTPQDFSQPVTYTVTAPDLSTNIYNVILRPVKDSVEPLSALVSAEIGSNRTNPIFVRNQSDYTNTSWNAYVGAINEAILLEGSSFPLISEYDTALNDLQNAIIGLVFVNKPDLDSIIAQIQGLIQSQYSTVSWASFVAARDIALALPETINTQVNEKSLALQNAINVLRKDVSVNPLFPAVQITEASYITTDAGVPNPSIDLTPLNSGGITLPGIDIFSSDTSIIVNIPYNTVVTSTDAGWDFIFDLPTLTTVTLPTLTNTTRTQSLALQLGDMGSTLTFSQAIRILLPSQSDKRVGFMSNTGDFTEINTTCSADNQSTANLLSSGSDCKMNVGADMIIWTKHLTTFVTYTQTTVSSGGGGGGGGGGGFSFTSTPAKAIKTYAPATLLSKIDPKSNDPATRLMTVTLSLDAGGHVLDTQYTCQNKHTDTATKIAPAYTCQVAERAQKNSIISPINTTFKPLQTVSRAEAYSIFMKSACVHPVTTAENWIAEVTKKAIELKFSVRTPEKFEPNRLLTIYEMYIIADQVKKYATTNGTCDKK